MKTFLRTLTHPILSSALVALALTGLLYGNALGLPLFSDDLVQIPWLETITWRELWTSPSPYGYYRPLWYTLWRVWGKLTGGLHPVGLHALNVVLHFVAAWLSGLLAAAWIRLDAGQGGRETLFCMPACLATALFAVFPFSRQAVAWPGAVYNPLVSAMTAGALLAYDQGRRSERASWIGLALLLAALAPLNYEAGLLVGPMVMVAEGVGLLHRRWPRPSWWALAFVMVPLVTLALWRAMRGTGVTGFGLTPSDLQRNAGYLVQGLIYPTAPLAHQLVAEQGLDSQLSLWLVALPTLAMLTWGGLRYHSGAFCLGAAWAALFALPPLVSMKADWFALAPRFLYMTAGGVSLVWATAIGGWLTRVRPDWRGPTAAALLVALLAPAALFVREGMRLYEIAGESIWDAVEAATREQPVLLVNLPMRITPHRRTYPLGFEGITPLPMRVTAEELVAVHTGIHNAAQAMAFGIVAADEPPGYAYQLFGPSVGWEELASAVRQSRAVHLARYKEDRIHLIEAGGSPAPASTKARSRESMASFGDRVSLLDVMGICDENGHIQLIAHWRTDARVKTDATVFAHLLGPDGTLVAQADGHPLLGMVPFWLWEPGQVMRDVHHFDSVPAGRYTVRMGIWELASGEQWRLSEMCRFPSLHNGEPPREGEWPAVGCQDDTMFLEVRCPGRGEHNDPP